MVYDHGISPGMYVLVYMPPVDPFPGHTSAGTAGSPDATGGGLRLGITQKTPCHSPLNRQIHIIYYI